MVSISEEDSAGGTWTRLTWQEECRIQAVHVAQTWNIARSHRRSVEIEQSSNGRAVWMGKDPICEKEGGKVVDRSPNLHPIHPSPPHPLRRPWPAPLPPSPPLPPWRVGPSRPPLRCNPSQSPMLPRGPCASPVDPLGTRSLPWLQIKAGEGCHCWARWHGRATLKMMLGLKSKLADCYHR
jgi:hypothetical protein